MSKVLVVYGTTSGCTEGIAAQIGKTLEEMGAAVDVVSAKGAPNAAGYDAVLVGSGVRAGSWHKSARDWVADNADALKSTPVAFFTCGLVIRDEGKAEEVRAYTKPVEEVSGVTPVDVGLFAGWNEPKQMSFPERTVLKVMKAPKGDFRDFEAVKAWTKEVARKLRIAG